mgnify:FL=1
MEFKKEIPKYNCIKEVPNYYLFMEHGQPELCSFLINFFGLDEVRFQAADLTVIKKWLQVEELEPINPVEIRGKEEICLVSQIVVEDKLIAYYPYVLVGSNVPKISLAKGFLTRITEAVSEQVTACFVRGFKGGDWLFGDTFAQRLIANCITRNEYKEINFAHLIEKMEQLSVSTFEGRNFTTGVIVTKNLGHYDNNNKFRYDEVRHIDQLEKRDWFLADGQTSFLLMDTNTNIISMYIAEKSNKTNYIEDFFRNYYRAEIMNEPDFIVRTVGPNEISVSDLYGKEFVKVENVWRFRYKRNFVEFLQDKLELSNEICDAIIYYTLKCSRNHISSIIWIPNNAEDKDIEELTTANRIRIWDKKLNILVESNEAVIDKVLASDGAIVIEKNGDVLYESVSSKVENVKTSGGLVGTGETATRNLAQNGVAIKVSQDGTIKVFAGIDKFFY